MAIDKQESVKSLFTAQSAKVDTNRGEAYYEKLYTQCRARLDELKKLAPVSNRIDFKNAIEDEGIDRRDFLKWASATTAMLMLPASFTPLVAEAAVMMNRVPVVWIEREPHLSQIRDCGRGFICHEYEIREAKLS